MFSTGAPDKIQVSVKSTIFNDSIVIALGVTDLSDAPAQNLSAKLNWISDTETINFTNIPVKNKDFSEAINEKLNDVFPGNYSLTVTANNVLGTYKVLEQTLFVPGKKTLSRIVINCPKLYQVVYYNTMHCVERVVPREGCGYCIL